MMNKNKQNRATKEARCIRIAFQNMVANALFDTWIVNRVVRPFLIRGAGAKCAKAVILRKGIYYGDMHNLQIGDHTAINRDVFLDAYDKITIGSNVGIGFRAILNTSTHEIGSSESRVGGLMGSPIVVEDGVWIGAGAYVGPDVTLGRGCVVSAGAVVMRSVEPNVVVAGCPARVIQRLQDDEKQAVSEPEECRAKS